MMNSVISLAIMSSVYANNFKNLSEVAQQIQLNKPLELHKVKFTVSLTHDLRQISLLYLAVQNNAVSN